MQRLLSMFLLELVLMGLKSTEELVVQANPMNAHPAELGWKPHPLKYDHWRIPRLSEKEKTELKELIARFKSVDFKRIGATEEAKVRSPFINKGWLGLFNKSPKHALQNRKLAFCTIFDEIQLKPFSGSTPYQFYQNLLRFQFISPY